MIYFCKVWSWNEINSFNINNLLLYSLRLAIGRPAPAHDFFFNVWLWNEINSLNNNKFIAVFTSPCRWPASSNSWAWHSHTRSCRGSRWWTSACWGARGRPPPALVWGARIRIKIFIYFRFGFTSLETNKISFYQTLYNMSFIRKLGGEVRIFKNLCGCGRRILSSLTYSRREGRRGSIYFCNVNKKSIIRK